MITRGKKICKSRLIGKERRGGREIYTEMFKTNMTVRKCVYFLVNVNYEREKAKAV